MEKELYSKISDRILSGKTLSEAISFTDSAMEFYEKVLQYLKDIYNPSDLIIDEDDLEVGVSRITVNLPEFRSLLIYVDLVEETIGITPFDGMNKAINTGKTSKFNLTDFKATLKRVVDSIK